MPALPRAPLRPGTPQPQTQPPRDLWPHPTAPLPSIAPQSPIAPLHPIAPCTP